MTMASSASHVVRDFVISRVPCRATIFRFLARSRVRNGHRDDSDEPGHENLPEFFFGAALLLIALAPLAHADDFELSHNQRIACSRGLSAGKLNTATCRSYAYLFNTKTSEYFRCQVSLALTRDNKEVINVQADGGCTKNPRIFDTDGNYSFHATE